MPEVRRPSPESRYENYQRTRRFGRYGSEGQGEFFLPQTPEEWAQLRDLERRRSAEEMSRMSREANPNSYFQADHFYRNPQTDRYSDERAWGFQNDFEQQYAENVARELGIQPGQSFAAFNNWLLQRLRGGQRVSRADAQSFAQRAQGDFSGAPGGTPAFQNPARPDGTQWNKQGTSYLRRPRERPMQPQAYQGAPAQYGQAVQAQPITQPQRPANPYQNPAQATQPGRTPPTEREQPSYGGTSYADPMQLSSAMGTLGYNATKKTPLDEAMERFR